jgi:hypothetical protein
MALIPPGAGPPQCQLHYFTSKYAKVTKSPALGRELLSESVAGVCLAFGGTAPEFVLASPDDVGGDVSIVLSIKAPNHKY